LAGAIKAAAAIAGSWYRRGGTIASVIKEIATQDGDDILRPNTAPAAGRLIIVQCDLTEGEAADAFNATPAEPGRESAP
jgi:hypothetical protein